MRHLSLPLLAAWLLLGGCRPSPDSAEAAPRAVRVEVPAERPLRAGFLVLDGVYNTELAAPYDVLEHAAQHVHPLPGVEVFTVAPSRESVTTAEGLRILPHYSFADHPPIDVLVVPSTEGSRDADRRDGAVVEWIRRVGREAQLVVSLCWGAFLLLTTA